MLSFLSFKAHVIYAFFFGLNKSNIYTPNKVTNIEIPNFESRELFSNQKIKAYELIQNSDYSLINIWASWCLPCRDEHPILIYLQDKKKLNLIGINYKDKKKNSIKFLNELGNPYDTIIIDKNGLIAEGDTVICFNFRSDRPREITSA